MEGSRVNKGPRPFRYLHAWSLDGKDKSHISRIWTNLRQDIIHLLHLTKDRSSRFKKDVFGHITARKRKIEK